MVAPESTAITRRVAAQVQRRPYTSSVVEPKARSFFASSIGTKVLVGITGILLVLYLIIHLFGNLLFLLGPDVFNGYANALMGTPLVVPVEIGLVAVFILHVYKAVVNWFANRRARPVGYYRRKWGGRPSRKTIASSTMIFSGLVLLIFLPIHVAQMKYGVPPESVVQAAARGAEHNLYAVEQAVFSNPLNVAFYMLAMVVVGSHLYHGVHSAFQSLGADHPKYTPWILAGGKVLAVILGFGFFIIPPFAYFFGGR
jgi:succinate dehydrogenase / fumarate reductase, cytochrome b subunit